MFRTNHLNNNNNNNNNNKFLLSLRGHRASTNHHHLVLFPAILLNSLQLFPFSNASLWTVLRHVCLGLLLLLFPCGFQSKASLSVASCRFLSVCPIHLHFRLLIYVNFSISPVLLQSSSFELTSGQWMFRIRRKQRLTKVCSLDMVIFISVHISDPYNNTDLTLLQKMRSLVNKAPGFFKMSVTIYQPAWHYIPKHPNLQQHYIKNIAPRNVLPQKHLTFWHQSFTFKY
jgi:hypothetical protein